MFVVLQPSTPATPTASGPPLQQPTVSTRVFLPLFYILLGLLVSIIFGLMYAVPFAVLIVLFLLQGSHIFHDQMPALQQAIQVAVCPEQPCDEGAHEGGHECSPVGVPDPDNPHRHRFHPHPHIAGCCRGCGLVFAIETDFRVGRVLSCPPFIPVVVLYLQRPSSQPPPVSSSQMRAVASQPHLSSIQHQNKVSNCLLNCPGTIIVYYVDALFKCVTTKWLFCSSMPTIRQ